MAQSPTQMTNRPVWVDLSSKDPAASREFYARLFGWNVEVNPDPMYGGYAIAKIGDAQAAGIGPSMDPNAPTAWTLYIGTDDADALSKRVEAAGGKIVAPTMDVGDQGRMLVFQDPAGAFIAAWEARAMRGFAAETLNAYGWAELNARGVERALPFYGQVFGWTTRASEMGEGQPPYHEFLSDGESVAGAWEMNPAAPAEMPSYWMVYFDVEDVDGAYRKALDGGAHEMLAPQDFPGGRFAIVSDPQGATFGLLKLVPRA